MGELKDRVNADTPDWFVRIINIGLGISAAGGAILTAGEVIPHFVLTGFMQSAAQWMIVAGLVAGAVSKTAKQS